MLGMEPRPVFRRTPLEAVLSYWIPANGSIERSVCWGKESE